MTARLENWHSESQGGIFYIEDMIRFLSGHLLSKGSPEFVMTL